MKEWAERFGIYFLGVGIGLVMVGFLVTNRSRVAASGEPGFGDAPVMPVQQSRPEKPQTKSEMQPDAKPVPPGR